MSFRWEILQHFETETQLAPTCMCFSLLQPQLLLKLKCQPGICCYCEVIVKVRCLGFVRPLVFAVTSQVVGCAFSFFLYRKCPVFLSANVSQNLVRKESFWDVPPLEIQFLWSDFRGKVQIIFCLFYIQYIFLTYSYVYVLFFCCTRAVAQYH